MIKKKIKVHNEVIKLLRKEIIREVYRITMTKKYWECRDVEIQEETRLIINEYLLSLKLANKAENTIVIYRKVLERFFSTYPLPIELLTSANVLLWLINFSKDKKERTVDIYVSALSSFFNFCLAEDYVNHMVIKKRWRPRISKSLPQFLNEQEFARVKMAAEKLSLRDRSLILFLFSSGCRRSEVSNLTIQDVNISRRTAEVKGKGKKIRHVHFSEECALILSEYLSTRSGDKNEALFLNRFGTPLQTGGIYNITTKLGKMAGLTHLLNPHSCRHTFATNMLAKGADVKFIADELGHTNLNTTRVYARIPTEDMILAYQNKMG